MNTGQKPDPRSHSVLQTHRKAELGNLYTPCFPVSYIGHIIIIKKTNNIPKPSASVRDEASWSYQSLQSCLPTQFLLHARIQHLTNSTRCHGAPLWRRLSHADPGRREPPCVFVYSPWHPLEITPSQLLPLPRLTPVS